MPETGSPRCVVMARMSKLSETRDHSFDLDFWQAQDSSARFAAS